MIPIKKKSKVLPRQLRAMQLREMGFTYKEIARMLGYCDASGARKAVDRALNQTYRESVETYRRIGFERLELVLNQAMSRVLNGHMGSARLVVRIVNLEAKLMRVIDREQDKSIKKNKKKEGGILIWDTPNTEDSDK